MGLGFWGWGVGFISYWRPPPRSRRPTLPTPASKAPPMELPSKVPPPPASKSTAAAWLEISSGIPARTRRKSGSHQRSGPAAQRGAARSLVAVPSRRTPVVQPHSQIQEILRSIQVEATLYNMYLNMEKTEILVHPNAPDPDVRLVDGTKMNTVYSAKYLGTHVAWEHTSKQATEARKTKAHTHTHTAYMKLQNLWRSRLCWKAKARLFHSCSRYRLDRLVP